MKKILSTFALSLSLLVLPALAQAEVTPEGFYAGAGLDFTFPGKFNLDVNYDDDTALKAQSGAMFGGGLKLGYAFGLEGRVSPRFEFAVDYTRGKFDGEYDDYKAAEYLNPRTFNNWGVMFNALFDVNVNSKFYPYFGAGFGLDFVNIQTAYKDSEDVADIAATIYVPKVQAILGLGYNITDSIGLFAEARVDARFGANADIKFMTHSLVNGDALMRPGFTLATGLRVSF